MEMKQGSLETKMGQGEVRIGVPVWGYTECNKRARTTWRSMEEWNPGVRWDLASTYVLCLL